MIGDSSPASSALISRSMFSIKSLLPLAFAIFSTFFNPSSNCSLSFMDVLRKFLTGVDRMASEPRFGNAPLHRCQWVSIDTNYRE